MINTPFGTIETSIDGQNVGYDENSLEHMTTISQEVQNDFKRSL